MRQDVGHQRTLISGAIYTSTTSDEGFDLSSDRELFIKALTRCIKKHPILSAVIVDGNTETPSFALLETLDLSKHMAMYNFSRGLSEENEGIEDILADASDEQFPSVDKDPPWKVILVSLPKRDATTSRLLALFAYYHSHGDGKSGLAFHQTFFEGLHEKAALEQGANETISELCKASSKELPPPMEKAGKLSLSWSYLLSPLIGAYLPNFLSTMLGFRASAVAQDSEIWCGKDLSFNPRKFRTGLAMITIEHDTMKNALQRCKARQTSFTGLLNQLIARSLRATLCPEHSNRAFASQIVVDLRRLFQDAYSDGSMTNCVSACNETIPSTSTAEQSDWTSPTNAIWTAARNTTSELTKCAGTLHNQPIGLLQYLHEFRPWTLGQIGKKRECSYEISNLVVFDPASQLGEHSSPHLDSVRIERTIFAQPANAAGACLNFNLVSTKNGPLVMTVTWQLGVLDVGNLAQEDAFVRNVCSSIGKDIRELAVAPL